MRSKPITLARIENPSRLIFFLADCAAACAALAITFNEPFAARIVWLVPLWAIIATTFFDPRRATHPRHAFDITCLTASVITAFTLVVTLDIFILYFITACAIASFSARWLCISILTAQPFRRKLYIIGDATVSQALSTLRSKSHTIVGVGAVGGVTVDQFVARLKSLGVTDVLFHHALDDHLLRVLLECRQHQIRIIPFTVFYEHLTGRVMLDHLDANGSDLFLESKWMRSYARALDIVGGSVGLIFLAAIFPAVAAAIWLDSGLPILYQQTRLGRDGRVFKLIKFRTMYQDAEQDGQVRWADLNDPRVTRVGRFLRRTRLDEVPQFWNVLIDEMSLIGPRPERPEIISMLESRLPFYRFRLVAKSGLTGWAQINYPYAATVDDSAKKLEYDLFYVKHRSLWLDMLIVWHTLKTIIQMSGM